MKRRPIVASLAAALVGATTAMWAGVASADPTEPPSPPPPVTADGGAEDMTAMMQACVDQMPPEVHDQAWRMHEQMTQTMADGMTSSMMPGGMRGSMMPGPTDISNAG